MMTGAGWLPIARPRALSGPGRLWLKPSARDADIPGDTMTNDGAGMQILVVDDSRMMRNMVIRALKAVGYAEADIIEAGDGVEALELIASGNPDVVLCDWNMPRLNGIDVLKQLRAAGDDRPLVFVTSEGAPGIEEQALAAGAHSVIVKPFAPTIFATTLAELTAETRSA